jgi:1-acyl-sn-glycerol-3-phosphate acyltransferase
VTGSPPPPAIPVRLVVGAVTFSIFALNTVFWCLLLYVIALVKLLVPAPPWRRLLSRGIVWIAERWIAGNALGLRLTQQTRWEVTGLEELEGLGRDTSVLVVSNHQSAVDIPVLQTIFLGKIPFLRFLLKKILIWVPFLGPAWWALDFPFMKRYSREFLEKHPEKRVEDLEATRRACERFADLPVSILSFAEGTRFTPEKKRRSSSPFRNLLAPKTGGLAFTVSALGATLRAIVDVTIVYPAGRPTFWDAISQGVPRIVVKVRQVEIPDDWFAGDYQGDAAFRGRVQAFVQKLWQEKDALIDAVS